MTFDRALSHLSFALGAMTPFIGANIEYLLAVNAAGLSHVHALVIATGGAVLIGASLLAVALLVSIVSVRPTHPALRFAYGLGLFFACVGAAYAWASYRSTGGA